MNRKAERILIMAQWYFSKEGKTQGPHSEAHMKELIQQGLLRGHDLAYSEGDGDWKKIFDWPVFMDEIFNKDRSSLSQLISLPQNEKEMKDQQWIVLIRHDVGQEVKFGQEGPFSLDEVKQKLLAGVVKYSDHVWRPGNEKWQPLFRVEEFKYDTLKLNSNNQELLSKVQEMLIEESKQAMDETSQKAFLSSQLDLDSISSPVKSEITGDIRIEGKAEEKSKTKPKEKPEAKSEAKLKDNFEENFEENLMGSSLDANTSVSRVIELDPFTKEESKKMKSKSKQKTSGNILLENTVIDALEEGDQASSKFKWTKVKFVAMILVILSFGAFISSHLYNLYGESAETAKVDGASSVPAEMADKKENGIGESAGGSPGSGISSEKESEAATGMASATGEADKLSLEQKKLEESSVGQAPSFKEESKNTQTEASSIASAPELKNNIATVESSSSSTQSSFNPPPERKEENQNGNLNTGMNSEAKDSKNISGAQNQGASQIEKTGAAEEELSSKEKYEVKFQASGEKDKDKQGKVVIMGPFKKGEKIKVIIQGQFGQIIGAPAYYGKFQWIARKDFEHTVKAKDLSLDSGRYEIIFLSKEKKDKDKLKEREIKSKFFVGDEKKFQQLRKKYHKQAVSEQQDEKRKILKVIKSFEELAKKGSSKEKIAAASPKEFKLLKKSKNNLVYLSQWEDLATEHKKLSDLVKLLAKNSGRKRDPASTEAKSLVSRLKKMKSEIEKIHFQ